MTEEEKNVTIISAAYALWGARDPTSIDHWLNLMADDVDFRSLGEEVKEMPFAQAATNREGVAKYFAALAQEWEMIHYTVDNFITQGNRVVAEGRCGWKHCTTGKTVDTPKVDLITMKNGKITAFMEMFDTAKARDAALA